MAENYTTWHHTWISLMNNKCLWCPRSCSVGIYPFGAIWPHGPAWVKVCGDCVYKKRVENIGFVSGTHSAISVGIPKRLHEKIPSFPVFFPTFKDRSAHGIPSRWQKTTDLKAEVKRAHAILTASLIGKQDRLRQILAAYESDVRSSFQFRQLLQDFIDYDTTISMENGGQITKLYDELKRLLSAVRQLHASDSWRWSYPFPRGSLGDKPLAEAKARLGLSTDNWTWLDLIHLGMVTQEAFLEEYCAPNLFVRS